MKYNILLVYRDNNAVLHKDVVSFKMDEKHLYMYSPVLKDRIWMDMLKEVEIKINHNEEAFNA